MKTERIFRVGEKLISLNMTVRHIEQALELRENGLPQQEVARRLNLDRSFISRLESIGEIRKGKRVAVIGFPISNSAELSAICQSYGLDFYLLLNDSERWDMVRGKQALDFFNSITELVTRLRQFDTLVMVSSEKWHKLAEALFNIQVLWINLGKSPIEEDQPVDPGVFKSALSSILAE